MKTRIFLATALFAVATLLMPMQAQAMSVRQYESEPVKQQGTDAGDAIRKIVADVAKVNPALSQAIHDYFYVVPAGQPEAPGLIAFEGGLVAVNNLAAQGKLDPDKFQIEGILLDLVKTNVMPKFAQNAATAQP
jgi:hypothetical protein